MGAGVCGDGSAVETLGARHSTAAAAVGEYTLLARTRSRLEVLVEAVEQLGLRGYLFLWEVILGFSVFQFSDKILRLYNLLFSN